jgi:lipopolysaccharide transport system permease protein
VESLVAHTRITAKPEELHQCFNPIRMVRNIWSHQSLIRQMTWREVAGRYKGSYLGLFWSFLNPLLLLVIFTFVFSVIFKAKWGISITGSKAEFALTLFCGLVIFNFFSECINRAPTLVLAYSNYVKKTRFPVEILTVAAVFSSVVHLFISTGILLLGIQFFLRVFPWTIVYFPIVVIFLIALTMGLTWFLSSLGVFIRDISYFVGFLTTALFFLTPIFYPISAVPAGFQTLMKLNPLSVIVECSRQVLMWGKPPDWAWLGGVGLFSFAVLVFGYGFFIKSKRAISDVV